MAVVGIDLGTTNSLVAIWRDGKTDVIPNALGEKLTPSVVSLSDKGEVIVGRAAKNRLVTHPERTVSQFKRLMGTKERVNLGGKRFLPEELSALVLKQLKQDAEAWLGEVLSEAVISVPAYFNDNQRRATVAAARVAGLHVERLINEPTAAAVAYGLHEDAAEAQMVVVDLGGGTLDVSILEKFDELLEVHASAGDSFLGGEDFTHSIVTQLARKYSIDLTDLSPQERGGLYRFSDKVKESLSENQAAQFEMKLAENTRQFEISRDEFSKWSATLMERFSAPLERAIRDAKLKRDDVADVILVGGASRMPIIKNYVGRLFGRIPSSNLDPDQVVVMGAAIQAAMKARNKELKETILTDVCPYSLGVNVAQEFQQGYQSGFFDVILQRNSVIPISRVSRYRTVADNQPKLSFGIFQGESRLVKNNIYLGQVEIEVPTAAAGEECADVRFTYNVNGILEVIISVPSTGEEKILVLQNSPNQLTDEEIAVSLEKIASYRIHPRESAKNIALLSEAERMYSEHLGYERDEIQQLIYQFEYALESQDPEHVEAVGARVKARLEEIKSGFVF